MKQRIKERKDATKNPLLKNMSFRTLFWSGSCLWLPEFIISMSFIAWSVRWNSVWKYFQFWYLGCCLKNSVFRMMTKSWPLKVCSCTQKIEHTCTQIHCKDIQCPVIWVTFFFALNFLNTIKNLCFGHKERREVQRNKHFNLMFSFSLHLCCSLGLTHSYFLSFNSSHFSCPFVAF